MAQIRRIAVFSGSSFGINERYRNAAIELGKEMAKRSIDLVYGGGYKGLMGAIAESVRDEGGRVIGVLPEAMNNEKVRLKDVETELYIVTDMHERKNKMYSLSDGFIALPGGIGTLEELCEIYTWRQLGIHKKNIALLNTEGYWNPFIAMLDKAVEEDFLSAEVREILIIEESPAMLLNRIENECAELPSKL